MFFVRKHLPTRYSLLGAALQGELTLAIGNPDAVERDVRFIHDDLNRCFQETETAAQDDSSIERSRAKDLCSLLKDLDVLVDLHATNKPSEPFARLPGPLDAEHFGSAQPMPL